MSVPFRMDNILLYVEVCPQRKVLSPRLRPEKRRDAARRLLRASTMACSSSFMDGQVRDPCSQLCSQLDPCRLL
jgi:hypothetical protein